MYKSVAVSQAEALKEENDSLRCQLDAYRNEVELLKQEQGKNQPIRSEEDNTHSQQLSFLQQALQGMQKVALITHTHTHIQTLFSNHKHPERNDIIKWQQLYKRVQDTNINKYKHFGDIVLLTTKSLQDEQPFPFKKNNLIMSTF